MTSRFARQKPTSNSTSAPRDYGDGDSATSSEQETSPVRHSAQDPLQRVRPEAQRSRSRRVKHEDYGNQAAKFVGADSRGFAAPGRDSPRGGRPRRVEVRPPSGGTSTTGRGGRGRFVFPFSCPDPANSRRWVSEGRRPSAGRRSSSCSSAASCSSPSTRTCTGASPPLCCAAREVPK